MRPKFRKKAGKPITLPYEIVVKTVHGQSVPVKVYAAQYAQFPKLKKKRKQPDRGHFGG